MMQWIATCGTIAASRVARGNVLLGAMDNIDRMQEDTLFGSTDQKGGR